MCASNVNSMHTNSFGTIHVCNAERRAFIISFCGDVAQAFEADECLIAHELEAKGSSCAKMLLVQVVESLSASTFLALPPLSSARTAEIFGEVMSHSISRNPRSEVLGEQGGGNM